MAYEWRDGPEEDYKKSISLRKTIQQAIDTFGVSKIYVGEPAMLDRIWYLNQMTSCVVQMGNHPVGSEPYERYRKSYDTHLKSLGKLHGFVLVTEAEAQRLEPTYVPVHDEHPSWYTKFCEVDAQLQRVRDQRDAAERSAQLLTEQARAWDKDRYTEKERADNAEARVKFLEKEIEAIRASRVISKTVTLRITGDPSDHKSFRTNLVEIRDR
jgi:hypothetical protein